MRKLAICLVGLLLIAVPVLAAEEDAEVANVKKRVRKSGDFLEVTYAGYQVRTDIDEQFAAEGAVYLRKFRDAFRSFLKPEPVLKLTPTVYFFKDSPTYHAYLQKMGRERPAWSAGLYTLSLGENLSGLFLSHSEPGSGFKGFDTAILRHEGAHQLLQHLAGNHAVPVWYTEGIATFFESWDIGKSRQENLKALEKAEVRGEIKGSWGTEDFYDLHQLMAFDGGTWDVGDAGKQMLLYAEAQSFMTFLLTGEKGRLFCTKIFTAIRDGKDPSKMLGWKTIDGAEKAWYADIERRLGRARKSAPK